jgi:hypothetical protein
MQQGFVMQEDKFRSAVWFSNNKMKTEPWWRIQFNSGGGSYEDD